MASYLSATTFLAGLALVATSEVGGAEKLTPPMSPPPVFGVARLNKAGKLELDQTVTTFVVEKRAAVVVRDGRKVAEEYTVYRPVFVTKSLQLEFKDITAFITPDKKLSAEDLRDELAKPRAVVMTTDGRKLDPFFVALLNPGTLIIVNKRLNRASPVPRAIPGLRPSPTPVKLPPRKAP